MRFKRLRDLREDNDLTQKKVAKYLNVSREAYQNYESGKRGVSIEILIKLADFYKTNIAYLIDETDFKDPLPKSNGKKN